ncbi:hypothetical protein [Methanobrevibacter filiformis]|uniref:Uncharacterized protein n=1 Tax=Methanobrevibacter filiformis TaxID=55758 RepID=A0A166APK5_9EURY|nr:hypothetical protein [Methanobrevibacter filiformis]KZX12304.1 hypothetical protein MBFIL_11710 [Methanobrevibacter filiformis]
MQGKSIENKPLNTYVDSYKRKRSKEEDKTLVDRYIVNDSSKKFSGNKYSYGLIAILFLVIAFAAGISFGFFGNNFQGTGDNSVIQVSDSAFPPLNATINETALNKSNKSISSANSSSDSSSSSKSSNKVSSNSSKSLNSDSSSKGSSSSSGSSSKGSSSSSDTSSKSSSKSNSNSGSSSGSKKTSSG